MGNIKRRTIVKGVAWSVPVIAAAAASPAFAASAAPDCTGGRSYVAPRPPAGSNVSDAAVTTSFVVPAGVRALQFEVVGGAGGTTDIMDNNGRRVTGLLPVTAGEVLTFVVGQGGAQARTSVGSAPVNPAQTGGKGYGNGGNAVWSTSGESNAPGGSGGGGSAILRGSVPLVVAGGGGGRTTRTAGPGGDWTGANNVNGAMVATSVDGQKVAANSATSSSTGPGTGGVGGTASGAGLDTTKSVNGNNGGNYVAGSGGRGADAVFLSFNYGNASLAGASGAGGGGYQGGGSGAVYAAGFTANASGSRPRRSALLTGRGTYGTNYTDPSVTNVAFSNGDNSVAGTAYRAPGSIIVTYCI